MKLLLVGLGKWGKNIEKTLIELGVEVLGVDHSSSQILLTRTDVDGVIIATPGSTHADVALPFIEQGIPVFIEKPMATSLEDVLRLEKAADQFYRGNPLVFVGHIHLYNPAFLKAKELIQHAGEIRYGLFEGMNWGPFRDDMSAMWDWAPHDIALAVDLFGSPQSVQAWGEYCWAAIQLFFAPHTQILINVSTLSPQKRKSMLIVGTTYSVRVDDTAEHKVSVHEQGQVSYPEYDATMPLTTELKAFLSMIETKKRPKTDIRHGVEVVKILDACQRSIDKEGKLITV